MAMPTLASSAATTALVPCPLPAMTGRVVRRDPAATHPRAMQAWGAWRRAAVGRAWCAEPPGAAGSVTPGGRWRRRSAALPHRVAVHHLGDPLRGPGHERIDDVLRVDAVGLGHLGDGLAVTQRVPQLGGVYADRLGGRPDRRGPPWMAAGVALELTVHEVGRTLRQAGLALVGGRLVDPAGGHCGVEPRGAVVDQDIDDP